MDANYNFESDIITRLQRGEKVKCPVCKDGLVTGIEGVEPSKCHYFTCGKCETHFHWDPMVVVE